MCLYTTMACNKRYTPTIKNRGIVPPVPRVYRKSEDGSIKTFEDTRITNVPIPCGKCMECRKKLKRNWQIRLFEELKHNETKAVFVTFTFNTKELSKLHAEVKEDYPKLQGYDIDNKIAKIAVRRYLERWRKSTKKSVRHWFVTELGHGEWEHLHLHGIIWTEKSENFIQDRWQYGNIWTSLTGKTKTGENGYVNEQTINYIVKYVSKIDKSHPNYKQLTLCSPGIGKAYIETTHAKQKHKYKEENTDLMYRKPNGRKSPIPTYYKRKLFDDDQRTELWRDMLDKQKMYIGGEEIDVSTYKGIEDYQKIREHYREINKEFGYGDNKINMLARLTENRRRNLIYFERTILRRKKRGQRTYEIESNLEKLTKSVSQYTGKGFKMKPIYELDLADDKELITLMQNIPPETHTNLSRKELKALILPTIEDAFHVFGAMQNEYL
ncbi:MAG: replication initiator protein [Microviridae sp.]|nr:MAG: replication initiator protein [Microviridae sp.]